MSLKQVLRLNGRAVSIDLLVERETWYEYDHFVTYLSSPLLCSVSWLVLYATFPLNLDTTKILSRPTRLAVLSEPADWPLRIAAFYGLTSIPGSRVGPSL